MTELTVAGLSDDRTNLVLSDPAGSTYHLPLDRRLRSLVETSRPPASPAPDTTPAESTLRPRDIQARVRAGESAETIAERSGVALAKVLPYALPVLDERRHIAHFALDAPVRGGESGALGELAEIRLRAAGVTPEAATWDAWRREDSRWTVRATYFVGDDEQQADFVYDATGRYVLPDDSIARWLVGVASTRGPVEPPVEGELPLQFDAAEPDAGRSRRGLRAVQSLPIDEPTSDADWMVTEAPPRPAAAPITDSADAPATAEHADEASAANAERSKPLRGRVKGRASVPSWDEIMFGAGDRT